MINFQPSLNCFISGLSLRGMNVSFLGNVYVNGQPVCDDQWDLLDAQVAKDA